MLLTGEGLSPRMVLEPHTNEVELTDTAMHQPVEHTLVLRNTSPFELPFECFLEALIRGNFNSSAPFGVHPKTGLVPAGETQELLVRVDQGFFFQRSRKAANRLTKWNV